MLKQLFHFGIFYSGIYHIFIMNKNIYTEDYKYMAAKLKKARISAGLNQVEVSKILGKPNHIYQKFKWDNLRLI